MFPLGAPKHMFEKKKKTDNKTLGVFFMSISLKFKLSILRNKTYRPWDLESMRSPVLSIYDNQLSKNNLKV